MLWSVVRTEPRHEERYGFTDVFGVLRFRVVGGVSQESPPRTEAPDPFPLRPGPGRALALNGCSGAEGPKCCGSGHCDGLDATRVVVRPSVDPRADRMGGHLAHRYPPAFPQPGEGEGRAVAQAEQPGLAGPAAARPFLEAGRGDRAVPPVPRGTERWLLRHGRGPLADEPVADGRVHRPALGHVPPQR